MYSNDRHLSLLDGDFSILRSYLGVDFLFLDVAGFDALALVLLFAESGVGPLDFLLGAAGFDALTLVLLSAKSVVAVGPLATLFTSSSRIWNPSSISPSTTASSLAMTSCVLTNVANSFVIPSTRS